MCITDVIDDRKMISRLPESNQRPYNVSVPLQSYALPTELSRGIYRRPLAADTHTTHHIHFHVLDIIIMVTIMVIVIIVIVIIIIVIIIIIINRDHDIDTDIDCDIDIDIDCDIDIDVDIDILKLLRGTIMIIIISVS